MAVHRLSRLTAPTASLYRYCSWGRRIKCIARFVAQEASWMMGSSFESLLWCDTSSHSVKPRLSCMSIRMICAPSPGERDEILQYTAYCRRLVCLFRLSDCLSAELGAVKHATRRPCTTVRNDSRGTDDADKRGLVCVRHSEGLGSCLPINPLRPAKNPISGAGEHG